MNNSNKTENTVNDQNNASQVTETRQRFSAKGQQYRGIRKKECLSNQTVKVAATKSCEGDTILLNATAVIHENAVEDNENMERLRIKELLINETVSKSQQIDFYDRNMNSVAVNPQKDV